MILNILKVLAFGARIFLRDLIKGLPHGLCWQIFKYALKLACKGLPIPI